MSNPDSDLLNRVFIATPCDVPWESMQGDERSRFCKQCKLNVYNIAQMSSKDAAELIRNNEDRLCLRLYRRPDGTLITDNCPRGLQIIRTRARRVAALLIAFSVSLGLIDAAHAQGLVGAPVDPRYGISGGYGVMPPDPIISETRKDWLGFLWQLLSANWIAFLFVRRISSTLLLGIGLAVIAGLIGVATGFWIIGDGLQ